MKVELENVKPMDIEKRSFEIITEELGDKKLVPGTELIRNYMVKIQINYSNPRKISHSDGLD